VLLCRASSRTRAPGPYAQISTYGVSFCGLTPAGGIRCVGPDAPPPELVAGTYTEVLWGFDLCATLPAGGARCFHGLSEPWSEVDRGIANDAVALAVGSQICALDGEGRASCVNSAATGVLRPPPTGVRFSELQIASRAACGISLQGELWCWTDKLDPHLIPLTRPALVD